MKTPKTFYKFREFNANTLSSLCKDELYFSNPGDFNDPLDCSPTINCDSNTEELEELFVYLTSRRIASETINHIKRSGLKVDDSAGAAYRISLDKTEKALTRIARNASYTSLFGPDATDNQVRLLVDSIKKELRHFYDRGVCCFSASYSSPLLWSHYGQQHKGLCIGYRYADETLNMMERVVYGGSRAINTSDLHRAFIRKDLEFQISVDRDVLLRKAKGWKYESEWRLIADQGLQQSSLLMTDITFGLRCELSIKHTVIKALERRTDLKFYEMFTVGHTFALRRRKVNIDELQAELPVMPIEYEDLR